MTKPQQAALDPPANMPSTPPIIWRERERHTPWR